MNLVKAIELELGADLYDVPICLVRNRVVWLQGRLRKVFESYAAAQDGDRSADRPVSYEAFLSGMPLLCQASSQLASMGTPSLTIQAVLGSPWTPPTQNHEAVVPSADDGPLEGAEISRKSPEPTTTPLARPSDSGGSGAGEHAPKQNGDDLHGMLDDEARLVMQMSEAVDRLHSTLASFRCVRQQVHDCYKRREAGS